MSVESSSFVRESRWIACTDRQTSFEIPVREGMAPNVYVSVTLVQPHGNTLNDAPISQYTDARYAGGAPLGLQVHPGLKMKVEFRNLRAAALD